MNGNQRKKLHYRLITRDGANCNNCYVSHTIRKPIIDHIDNNNRNNILENLQLLCRACNYRKNPRISERDSSYTSNENKHTGSSSIIINQEKEQKFRNFVYQEMIFGQKRNHSRKNIINGGAEIVGISPETANRYFKKLSSFTGLLESNGHIYYLKDTWWCKYPKCDDEIIQKCILNLKKRIEIKKTLEEENKEEETKKSETKNYLDEFFLN
jgi:hypothetical protein